MKLTRIMARNFKSFEHLDIKLNDFNVIIGPNAAGKSNFIDILKFLHNIATEGLESAVSLQGGIEYLRNVNVSLPEIKVGVEMESRAELSEQLPRRKGSKKEDGLKFNSYHYEITIKHRPRAKKKFQVTSEKIVARFTITGMFIHNESVSGAIKLTRNSEGSITISMDPPNLKQHFTSEEDYNNILRAYFFPFLFIVPETNGEVVTEQRERFEFDYPLSETESILESTEMTLPFYSWSLLSFFREISAYYLDPKLAKKAIPVIGKAELESDGSNMALILKKIIEDKTSRDRFFTIIQQMLPFIDRIDVKSQVDKSLIAMLQEKYSQKVRLPAFLISDGTILVTTMIIILYFEDKQLIILEEPERNLHPTLISKLIEMMIDAATHLGKQIIVTTHSTELIKHAPPNSILFLKRDERDNSIMYRPIEKEEVQQFLTEEMGLSDLFVMGLLEW